MKVFLFLFYNFVKLLVKISFRVFYEKVVLKNRHYLRKDNPCIMVSNHPSTMTDPMQVAHKAKRITHFLANASMFKHPFTNWFFSTFYCIPIERPKDVGGRGISNNDSFKKAEEFLQAGGLLYVAAEGYSQPERRLGRIKTGTARIALSTENKSNFELGLTIQPVGLNYMAHRFFRTKLFTYAGDPLPVANYKSLYKKDPRAAVVKLTEDISEAIRPLIIDTEDEAEDKLLLQLEEMLGNSKPLDLEENFFRNKKILDQLRLYRANYPSDDKAFRGKVQQYFYKLEKAGLRDRSLAEIESGDSGSLIGQGLLLLLGLPFFLYGWLNNFLANYIPLFITKRVNIFPGYDSTIKLMSGLVIYPVVYALQVFAVHQLFQNSTITWIYFLTLAPLGLLAWSYRKSYKHFLESKSWNKYKGHVVTESEQLLRERAAILGNLERLLNAK
ncbi:MAG: glycerol-3-phosphate O-acyltransferase/dihydroxyacetone phosphate acyltransferase [Patescibacteria group bacterium]